MGLSTTVYRRRRSTLLSCGALNLCEHSLTRSAQISTGLLVFAAIFVGNAPDARLLRIMVSASLAGAGHAMRLHAACHIGHATPDPVDRA
jgi:hypothetical protein